MDEGKTIQMRNPSKPNRIPGIYHWTRRGQERPSQDTSHLGLDYTQEKQRNPMLLRILQLVPTIQRRFSVGRQNRYTRKQRRNALANGNEETKNSKHSTNSGQNLPQPQYWSISTPSHRPKSKQTPQNTSTPVYCHNTPRTENGDQWHRDPRQCRTPNPTTTYMIRNY